jgi:hypothetical protein
MVSHEVFNPAMDKQRVKNKANYNPKNRSQRLFDHNTQPDREKQSLRV